MDTNSIIIILVIGALAGWLAGNIMKGRGFGVIGNIVVGIIGALIGGFLLGLLGGRPRIQSLANNLFGNKYQISSNHFMKSHCPQQKSPSGY